MLVMWLIYVLQLKSKQKMNDITANIAWEETLDEVVKENKTNLKKEDINILKTLSKLLGQTDVEGQVSQIEITQNFLDAQIKEARRRKNKK